MAAALRDKSVNLAQSQPVPWPPALVVKNGSKTRVITSGAMPFPYP